MIPSIVRERHHAIGADIVESKQTPVAPTVVIFLSYRVRPGAGGAWRGMWEDLAAFATPAHGCRCLRLLHDQHELTRYTVMSEWNDMASFNDFMRRTRLHWMERALSHVFQPLRCDMFDSISQPECGPPAPLSECDLELVPRD